MWGWRRVIAIACRLVGVAAAACALAGCVTANAPVSLEQAAGATISFDSIDGPPRPIYERLVRTLSDEAGARKLVVVPRGRESNYRIRGYLALQAGTVAWAWDVYDADRRRAFRLTGADPGAGSWAALDDSALRRIARTGIEQLTVFIAGDRSPTARAVASSSAPQPQAARAGSPALMAAAATDR
ncbi:MAG: hypothetical protein ACRECO_21120 [Xanthobacteraceae bacterium]